MLTLSVLVVTLFPYYSSAITCNDGQFRDFDCTACPDGKFCANNKVEDCPKNMVVKDKKCQLCKGFDNDENKHGIYSVKAGVCTLRCIINSQLTTDGTCVACPAGNTCDGTKTATPCKSPNLVYLNKCRSNCGRGFQIKDGKCELCPAGHICDGTKTATPCKAGQAVVDSFCRDKCDYRYHIKDAKCEACPKAHTCDGSATTTPCKAGEYSYSNKCKKCDTSKPKFYLHDNKCRVCTAYKYLKDGKCVACPEGSMCDGLKATACKAKELSKGDHCAPCPTTHYLVGDECKSCPENHGCDGKTATPCKATEESVKGKCTKCSTRKFIDNYLNKCTDCPDGHQCDGTDQACKFSSLSSCPDLKTWKEVCRACSEHYVCDGKKRCIGNFISMNTTSPCQTNLSEWVTSKMDETRRMDEQSEANANHTRPHSRTTDGKGLHKLKNADGKDKDTPTGKDKVPLSNTGYASTSALPVSALIVTMLMK